VPKIVASVQGLPNFFYGVATKTAEGFIIQMSEPQSADISFDWIALAQPTTTLSQSSFNELIVQLEPVQNPVIIVEQPSEGNQPIDEPSGEPQEAGPIDSGPEVGMESPGIEPEVQPEPVENSEPVAESPLSAAEGEPAATP